MSRFNVRPENALKRCEELIKVGMKDAALDILHTVLSNKRNRSTWQKVHEKIILRYLDLCVELRKGRIAKDGLHQYKSICQQVAIGSLEVAIRHLVKLSEDKAQQARDEVSAAMEALEDIDDLEELESPESLMMSSVTAEADKERKDRELLTPWLKFLWETYRTVLEILRNNNRLETLYQSIAQSAFAFCLKYQRKTELRRLGDMLRNHLQQIQKYSSNANSVNLNAPDSLQMHLETRFVQLATATSLELWQEAYRGIEDIHNLMTLSKKAPKPQMMAAYYSRLAEIFWRSDNRLVHAAALHKLFHLSINQNKNMSDDDKKRMASRLIIATLTIPVERVKGKAEEYLETDLYNKRSRLTTLLGGSTQAPTRKALIEEMMKINVLSKASPNLTELYKCLEVDFNPLKLCQRVEPILAEIEQDSELCIYLKPLQEIVLSRLLLQLSQVYATIRLEQITKLAKFFSVREIEYLVAKAVHNREMSARIDHKTRSVTFKSEAFCAQAPQVVEGPHIQVSRGERMRGQLTNLAQALHSAIETISEQSRGAMSLNPGYYEQKSLAMQDIVKNAHLEHKKSLDRRAYIERNKERAEELVKEKERLDQKRRLEARRADMAAEQKRLVEESKRREEARAQREADTLKRNSTIERMTELKNVMGSQSTVFDEVGIEEFSQMDAQEIVQKQVDFLNKEQKVMESKLKGVSRKLDHMERAKRQEEIPLFSAQYLERKEEDLLAWQRLQESKDADALAKHKSDLETKARMLTIIDQLRVHIQKTQSSHRAEFEASQSKFLEHVVRVRDERMEEERAQRELIEKERIAEAEALARREEEERQRHEEEERRREEEERRRAEMAAEREAEMERLRELEERKRQREEEIMARHQQERQHAAPPSHVEQRGMRNPPQQESQFHGGHSGMGGDLWSRGHSEPRQDQSRMVGGPTWRSASRPQQPHQQQQQQQQQRITGGKVADGGWRAKAAARKDAGPEEPSRQDYRPRYDERSRHDERPRQEGYERPRQEGYERPRQEGSRVNGGGSWKRGVPVQPRKEEPAVESVDTREAPPAEVKDEDGFTMVKGGGRR